MAVLARHGAPVLSAISIYSPSEEWSLLAEGEGDREEEESFTFLPGAVGRDSSLRGYDPEEALGRGAGDAVPALLLPLHPSG